MEAKVEDAARAGRGVFARVTDAVARVIGLAMAAFHLYTAFTVSFTPMIQRSVHLAFGLALLFLITPTGKTAGRWDIALRWLSAAASAFVTIYAAIEFTNPEIFRVIDPTPLDIACGTLLVLLLLEATRRTAGLSLAIVAFAFFLYAFLGSHPPGLLGHPGFEYSQVIASLYLRLEGIFGTATGSSATYVYVFVLFGAVMMRLGGGDFFINLAL